jgi:hypothetical protein
MVWSANIRKYGFFTGALFMTVMAGCGEPHSNAKQQTRQPLAQYPEYPVQSSDKSFALTLSQKDKIAYTTGTLLILKPELKAEDLAVMLTLSKDVRTERKKAKAHWLVNQGKDKELENSIKQLDQEWKRKYREALTRGVTGGDLTARLTAAQNWFDDEVLSRTPDETRRTEVKATFEAYCEAKIWQLAAQPPFAKLRYNQRPSPLVLCEDYYARQGFFNPQSEDCAASPGAAGKSYVSCLWREGVMKTALFGKHFAAKAAQFEELLAGDRIDDFTRLLSEAKTNQTSTPVLAGRIYFSSFYVNIMSLSEFKNPEKCGKAPLQLYGMKFPELCTLFKRAAVPAGIDIKTDLTPEQLINLVETGKETVDGKAYEFALPEVPGVPSLDASGGLATYGNLLQFFAGRETKGQQSESDAIFHVVAADSLAADAAVPSAIDKVVQAPHHPGMTDEQKSSFKGPFGAIYASPSAEDEAMLDKIKSEQERLKKEKGDNLAEHYRLVANAEELTRQAALTANRPSFAFAFLSTVVEVARNGSTYAMEVKFDNKSVKGCFDVSSSLTLAMDQCLDKPQTQLAADLFFHNPQTGEFRFAFKLDHAAELGIREPTAAARKNDYFNDIPLHELAGTTMELRLFPNNLDGVLNLMTGNLWIKRDGWREGDPYDYEGVVSLFD